MARSDGDKGLGPVRPELGMGLQTFQAIKKNLQQQSRIVSLAILVKSVHFRPAIWRYAKRICACEC
jgi:hypothetical protein